MATDDRFELVMSGLCLGKATRNVFYWVQTNGAALASGILQVQFAAEIQQAIRAVCSVQWQLYEVFVKNLDNDDDFAVQGYPSGQAGNIAGECNPPFVTWSLIYRRSTLAVRNGWKRFAGVAESWSENGVLVAGTPTTTMNVLAAALGDPVDDGIGTTFNPVIMRKTRQPLVGPFESFLYEEFPMGEVEYAHIGSQNTRKF